MMALLAVLGLAALIADLPGRTGAGGMAAFADNTSDRDITTIEKSCTAFTNTKALDNASGGGVCHQLLNCTKRLSSKVIDWLGPQL